MLSVDSSCWCSIHINILLAIRPMAFTYYFKESELQLHKIIIVNGWTKNERRSSAKACENIKLAKVKVCNKITENREARKDRLLFKLCTRLQGFKLKFSKIFWGGAHRDPSPNPSPRSISGFALGSGFALNSRALRALASGFALNLLRTPKFWPRMVIIFIPAPLFP